MKNSRLIGKSLVSDRAWDQHFYMSREFRKFPRSRGGNTLLKLYPKSFQNLPDKHKVLSWETEQRF